MEDAAVEQAMRAGWSWPQIAEAYDARIDVNRKKRNHVRQLDALGYTVTLQPAA